MDNKQTLNDKIAAKEILKDSQLDSVVGGGHAGGTGVGCFPVFDSEPVQLNPVNNVKYGGQLGAG